MAAEWEYRVGALEAEVADLRELVDGHEQWSHRQRLHRVENDQRAADLLAEALRELKNQRVSWWAQVREWGGFAVALAAILVAVFH